MNVVVNDLLIHYTDEGTGPVVLLLHGWGQDLRTFDQLTQKLRKNYRVVRLDFPGFGKSQIPTGAWGVNEYAQFLIGFLSKVNLQPYGVISHSFGGRVAIKAVARHELTAKKLVLMDSAGMRIKSASPKRAFYRLITKTGKLPAKLLPSSQQVRIQEKLYKMAGSTDYLQAGAMRQTFLKVIAEDLSADASEIKVSTLLIWGEEDEATPLAEAKLINESIVGSKLELIEDAGHFSYLDKPAQVSDLIKAHLK